MSYQGGDFGFVGQSYTAPDAFQDRQQTLNYFVEISQDDKSKTPTALLGAPGLNPLFSVSVVTGGEVRGCWVLPGGLRAIAVCGSNCAMIEMTVPATQTSIAQFSVTTFGTLLTNNGPVCIRDNGPGGQIVIVDGQYGYTVNISGAPVLTQIADAGFLGADRVAFIDGWLIFNQPDSQTFFTTGPTPYTITFP